MALNKVTYIARTTPVSSQNLNDIQDEIINNTVPKDTGGEFNGLVAIDQKDGTTSTQGWSQLKLGNAVPSGTNGNSAGFIRVYGTNQYKVDIYVEEDALTAHRNLKLPNNSGVVALTSDLSTVYTDRVSLYSGYTATSNLIRKTTSNIVEISLYATSATNFSKGSWVTIGLVPPSFCPVTSVYKMCVDNTNGYPVETRITPAGELAVWFPTSAPNCTIIAVFVMYMV